MNTRIGLCSLCQREVYARTYGRHHYMPKDFPSYAAYKQAIKASDKEYELEAKASETLVVVLDGYSDEDRWVELEYCHRHILEALDALRDA